MSGASRGQGCRGAGRRGAQRAKARGARPLHGDCTQVMAGLEAQSLDAVVCDPPYGIDWQGERWDGAAIREAAQGRERTDSGRTRRSRSGRGSACG